MWKDTLREQLNRHEGRRRFPYKDTKGILTIGVGRNLEANGLRPDEMDYMLTNDIRDAEHDARLLVQNFDSLSDNRKAVVVNLVFNMGLDTFSKFKNTIRLINAGQFQEAADALRDSFWYKQVGNRAVELTHLMEVG